MLMALCYLKKVYLKGVMYSLGEDVAGISFYLLQSLSCLLLLAMLITTVNKIPETITQEILIQGNKHTVEGSSVTDGMREEANRPSSWYICQSEMKNLIIEPLFNSNWL